MCPTKADHFFIALVMISTIGALAFTASDYVGCKDLDPDEFLDLALASEGPILPIFDPHRNTPSALLRLFKTLYFQEISLLATCLRC
jgi:hypothetical protein